jgi:hypothetical protein
MSSRNRNRGRWITPAQLEERKKECINTLQLIFADHSKQIDNSLIDSIAEQLNYQTERCISAITQLLQDNAGNIQTIPNNVKETTISTQWNNEKIIDNLSNHLAKADITSNSVATSLIRPSTFVANSSQLIPKLKCSDSPVPLKITPIKHFSTISLSDDNADNYVQQVAQIINQQNEIELKAYEQHLNQSDKLQFQQLSYEEANPLPHSAAIPTAQIKSSKKVPKAHSAAEKNKSAQSSEGLSVAPAVSIDRNELLDFLKLMFDTLQLSVIHAIVDSLNTNSISLDQLNECVETLLQLSLQNERDEDTEQFNARLAQEFSDLELAKQMEAEFEQDEAVNKGKGKINKPNYTKFDLTKQTNMWQYQSNNKAAPSLSHQWSLDALIQAFPSLEAELIQQAFIAQNRDFYATKSYLLELFPNDCVNNNIAPLPQQLQIKQKQLRTAVQSVEQQRELERAEQKELSAIYSPSSSNPSDKNRYKLSKAIVEEMQKYLEPTLSGLADAAAAFGNGLSNSSINYTQCDKTTDLVGKQFQLSTEAFLNKQYTRARELVLSAKQQLKSGSNQSLSINSYYAFHSNNRTRNNAECIDLHGLNRLQAELILEYVVDRNSSRGYKELYVITGAGNNSANYKSVLKAAVFRYCELNGYKYNEVNPGQIRIRLK